MPCNPICCAMCFHQDAGIRENDNEHKTGSIFANAASVLSMAAEEISLDDHLEKELANEVELWRMETTSTAVHTNDGVYKAVFAANGPEVGHGHSIDSASVLDSPNYGIESDIDDMAESMTESNGRSDRGRGYANYSYGSGQRQGVREGTGLSNVSSGRDYSLGHSSITAVTESREETATSSASHGRQGTAISTDDTSAGPSVSRQGTSSVGPADHLSTVQEQPVDGLAPPGRSGVGGAESSTAAVGTSPRRPDTPLEFTAGEPNGAAPIEAQAERVEETTVRDDTVVSNVPRDDTGVSMPVAGDSSAGGWLCNDADQGLAKDNVSVSSSGSEDSFPGFLEDPIEKEMQAPLPNDTLSNIRTVGPLSSDLEAAPRWASGQHGPQNVMKPSAKPSFGALEGVRADRSSF